MRWDALSLGGEQPGLFATPVTLDTPEFRGITFHEIRAKSIINRVPAAARLPFGWTINPYRGCSHACVYCLSGDTPILMADGRTRRLRDVRAGDHVYGTETVGAHRRYVVTRVSAHWRTVKPAYRIRLEDGTELIASGDHRFLSDRGWRYVTGSEHGAARRPHLTGDNRLMGTGRFAEPPKKDADYRSGYLSGVIHGDGTQKAAACQLISRIISRPPYPSTEWHKGFLAGISDAEGSRAEPGILRIVSSDPRILEGVRSSLASLGFDYVVEPARMRPRKPVTCVRLRGGLPARLRFLHTVDPVITRRRTIEGLAIECDAPLGVTLVEPLGVDLPMYDITTGTGDFIANGVVSHNCFARKSHEYLDFDSGRDFDSQIVVKVNAPELVRRELAAARWGGEHIAMGTNVDCYQRAEGRYRLMPGIIEALRDAANPFSILTKGSLILRDLPLLREAAERTDVGAAVSVGSVDTDLWRLIEPGTPSPLRRLEVCSALSEHGIGCAVLMGPIVPFLTDSRRHLQDTVRLAAQAGATSVTPITLHLRPGAREWFLAWLREHHPELTAPYARLYGRGAYAPEHYRRRIARTVAELAERHRVGAHVNPRRIPAPRPERPAPTQLTLL